MTTTTPGLGVMIQMLGGNADTVAALQAATGKTIASIDISDDRLPVAFLDGSKLTARDSGQSCCEHRYMKCDDNLTRLRGGEMTRSIAFNTAPHKRNTRYVGHEFAPAKPKTIKTLAKKFMAYRAAQRDANEPVDSFCRRGDDTPRFAYFD